MHAHIEIEAPQSSFTGDTPTRRLKKHTHWLATTLHYIAGGVTTAAVGNNAGSAG